jgi:hypothetical protein
MGWNGVDWISLLMAGSCDRVNGALGSIQMGNFLTNWETTRYSRRSQLHEAGRENFMACFCQFHLSVHPRRPCLRCSYLCTTTSHTHDAANCYTAEGGSKTSRTIRKETFTAKSVRTTSVTKKLLFKVLLTGESVQLQGMVKRVFLVVSSTRFSPLVSCLSQKQYSAA